VPPPNAETTTTISSFLELSKTMLDTYSIFVALATEVPPNLKTFICDILKIKTIRPNIYSRQI
jgi:hypothetical protein